MVIKEKGNEYIFTTKMALGLLFNYNNDKYLSYFDIKNYIDYIMSHLWEYFKETDFSYNQILTEIDNHINLFEVISLSKEDHPKYGADKLFICNGSINLNYFLKDFNNIIREKLCKLTLDFSSNYFK